MKEKLDYKNMQLYTCALSVILGIGLRAFDRFLPGSFDAYAAIFSTVGISGITYHYCTKSKYDRIFRNLKLGINECYYPIMRTKEKSDYSTTYKFTLPAGISVDDIKKEQLSIEQNIGRKVNIEYINKGQFIIEEFHKTEIDKYNYEPVEIRGNVPVLVGKDRKGTMNSFDLAEGTEPHLLIGGNTGCGKTTAIYSIIVNLILFTEVNLHLVDLKHGASFTVFKKCSHVKSFADTIEKAESVLKSLLDEIEARYQKMARNGFSDIREYNKRHKKDPMSYELLVIDEMIDFTVRKDLLTILEVISAKARGCGIHMIASTQRPDKDVLNGRIKCNITNVLGMTTIDATNSRIIIDTEGLEKLTGKGHGIISRLGKMTEIQTPFIDTDKVKELIKHTYISKSEPKLIPSEKIEIDVADLEVFHS
jgi:S-DNA-T family DNA segregation ATPase FtsK/SpoIIIE